MDRINKGKSAGHYVENYCVIDLETTGVFVTSADIIEISAIRVRKNATVDEFSTLVNPHCHIPAEATAVNNITDEMVKDAPDLEQVMDALMDFVSDDVIVGYNNARFDMNVVYDALMRMRGRPFTNDYIDVLDVARRTLSGVSNYKLETISEPSCICVG